MAIGVASQTIQNMYQITPNLWIGQPNKFQMQKSNIGAVINLGSKIKKFSKVQYLDLKFERNLLKLIMPSIHFIES